jgi:hypothetical protein
MPPREDSRDESLETESGDGTMSHAGDEVLGALVALHLSVAAVFWLCGIVYLRRLVLGRDEICDVDSPVDGMHMVMAAYMALTFFPGYSGRADLPAAAAFLMMTAALTVRAVLCRGDRGLAHKCAMTAAGGAAMGYMLLADSRNTLAIMLALLLAACAAAHVRTIAGTLRRPMPTGSQSMVSGGPAASAIMTTGMVIMLLQM